MHRRICCQPHRRGPPALYDSPMPLSRGVVFAGYTVIRLLGSGGMGEVYLAQHPRLPRRDALKILPADVSADREFRERFNREADLAATLFHPHIVGVHDRGEFDGQLWISMDYIDGTDAAQLVRDRHPNGMPPDNAIEIVVAIAAALDYAHAEGLLHRDVKPANVLLASPRSGERRILLADFGIARRINEISDLTQTNVTVGSVAYAAPEQLRGEPIDGRADQYALACTAFHLLAGAPPFDGTNPAVVIGQHLSLPPPNLSEKRPELAALDPPLAMAMSKNATDRYPSCTDLAKDLASRIESSSISSRPTAARTLVAAPVPFTEKREPGPIPTNRPGRKRALLTAFALAIAVSVIALAAIGLTNRVGSKQGSPGTSNLPAATSESAAPLPTFAPRGSPPMTTAPAQSTVTVTVPAPVGSPPATGVDLGLSTPISYPSCDGEGIVVLGNAVTPGRYVSDVQRLLNMFPGASYLRTDRACPSLRQSTETGNPIYAVYRVPGPTQRDVCGAVHAAGGDAYGKWLDTTTDPNFIIPC
jgi:serine/threonine-protein kinase